MQVFDRVFGRLRTSPDQKQQSPIINSGSLLYTDGKDAKLILSELSTEVPVTPAGVLEPIVANPFVEKEDLVLVEPQQSTPESVLVGIGESNPVSIAVTDPEKLQTNLALHEEHPVSVSLEISLRQLEERARDITRPIWELNTIKRQMTAIQEQIALKEGLPEEVAPVAVSEVKPETVIDDTDKTPKDGLDAIQEVLATVKQKKPETPLSDKEKVRAMLEVQERLASEAKRRAQEEERIEREKQKAGIIILQEENRIEALKRNIALIGQDIKQVDDQIAHREPQISSSRKKKDAVADPVLQALNEKSADLKAKAVSFEDRLKGSETARQEAVNRFLDLDGSEEQINALIRENIEPEVTGPKPVTIEVSDVAKEIAKAVPETLALGGAAILLEQSIEGGGVVERVGEAPEAGEKPATQENLEERITAARLAYVAKDVAMTNQWERLKRSFTWLEKTEDQDLGMLREKYRTLLVEKKETEIARIALLAEKERAQEILELGVYFKVAEGTALANLYAEKEKESISSKLGAALDWVGEKYNGLSKTKKVLIGVTLLGGSMALAATSGAGIALGAVAVRRFCAGLGGAVALDAAAEKFFSGRQEKKATAEIQDFIENEEGASPEEFAKKLNQFLDLENHSVDKQIDKKRRKTFFRKWSLRLGGVFGGLALSEYLSYLHDTEVSVVPESTDAVVGSGAEVPLPINEPTVSYNQIEGGATEGPAAPLAGEIPAPAVAGLPETYALTTADSQKGLWGVLEKSVPAELQGAEKTRAISSLQNLIATKLEGLSPEARTLAGFSSGAVGTIYAEDTLKLGNLVSPEEFQEIIDGKVIDAPAPGTALGEASGVPAMPLVATSEVPNTFVLEDTGGVVDEAGAPENLLAQVDDNSFAESDSFAEPVDGTAQLIGEGRVERAIYYQELEDTRRTIFATNDLRFRDSILNAPTVKMTDVVLAAKTPGETLVENRALLGTDQISRVNRFKELAVNAYGTVAEPGRNETVAAYTRRMVTIGFESPENKFNLDKLARV